MIFFIFYISKKYKKAEQNEGQFFYHFSCLMLFRCYEEHCDNNQKQRNFEYKTNVLIIVFIEDVTDQISSDFTTGIHVLNEPL